MSLPEVHRGVDVTLCRFRSSEVNLVGVEKNSVVRLLQNDKLQHNSETYIRTERVLPLTGCV